MSFNYISPIQLIVDDYQTTIEDEVMKVVRNTGIFVDKEELIKALKYDRQQYEKGYQDGQNAKHGKWEYDLRDGVYSCSICGNNIDSVNSNYCGLCGAKMDKE